MAKKIENLNFEELVAGEKSATIVRRAYEDKMVMYRGINYDDMRGNEKEEYLELSKKLAQINAIRLRIINEMEARLLDIE
jgi:hypothetical protein